MKVLGGTISGIVVGRTTAFARRARSGGFQEVCRRLGGMASPSLLTRSMPGRLSARQMLNKVPEITLYFWVIKILATTVGETAADYLNSTLGLGLTGTTFVMSGFLIVALIVQFSLKVYVPFVYWLSVVLISVVGTLFSDNLVDNYGIGLPTTTAAFAIALAIVFGVWYWSERTLSIHSIVTTKREAFYWLAVLFTFALGTSAGDLTAEKLAVGYWQSAVFFAALIAATFIAHVRFNANAILTFWIAYILTRPLGASIGDYLSQPSDVGGLALGTTVTSIMFLVVILVVVVYLSITKADRIERASVRKARAASADADAAPVHGMPRRRELATEAEGDI
jgi:uncharacterized membrane-anchored protein